MSDGEVILALKRITRDHSLGILNDRVTPSRNARLLKEELLERGYSNGDLRCA